MTERSDDCAAVQAAAPELALDVLPGPERATMIEHIRRCGDCRRTVEGLAGVADGLLLLAPQADPPAGFEARVLTLMSVAPPAEIRRRRRRLTVLAAAAAVTVLAVAGALVAATAGGGDDARVATFRSQDGEAAGRVVLTEGTPDEMVCVFEDPRFEGAYTVELVVGGGRVVDAGDFWVADGGGRAWSTDIPVDASDVEAIRVRSDDGEVRSTATF